MSEPARTVALRIVGFAGSLRAASLNRALLLAARDLSPREMSLHIEELGEVPLFNADLSGASTPKSVVRLRNAVQAADGLLLATPEYNHGVPGVLKNAIDWLSQPLHASPLEGKPTAIIGASTGFSGSARGQMQLRQSLVLTNTPVMLQPEVLVGRAHEKFDVAGRLTDEGTRQFIANFLIRFVSWAFYQKDSPGNRTG